MQNADRQSSNKPCRAFPTRRMRTRIFPPLLLLLVALGGVAANCFNAEGRPVWCAPRASLARQLAMPEHNHLLRQIAAAERVRLFDLDAAMTKDDEHMPDGIHVSQAGSDLKCKLLFHYFVGEELVPELLSGCSEPLAHSPPTAPAG